jgi:hypothetical protein
MAVMPKRKDQPSSQKGWKISHVHGALKFYINITGAEQKPITQIEN